jgi:hypothetical protein
MKIVVVKRGTPTKRTKKQTFCPWVIDEYSRPADKKARKAGATEGVNQRNKR